MARYRVTVDTGGTFSDFVYFEEESGRLSIGKLPSTPDDPSRAIMAGLQRLFDQGVAPDEVTFFCHGTTVATNALLEGKGARTGLLVTEGFRGIYEVQEQSRPYGPAIFDIFYDKPTKLAPARLTGEVRERISSQGETLRPLDEEALRQTARRMASRGVESIAVCLLFSYLAPGHERRVRDILTEEIPGVSVSLSSDIVPQIREYYRLSTTVINAYLRPILARYIHKLDADLQRASVTTSQKFVMQSNGGMATFAATAERAVATVLSGPAGGVIACLRTAREAGCANVVAFDMGGTSCDVALIKDYEAALTHRGKIEGRDVALPMIEINTVSAGGGTLARVDELGSLIVGPQSAGAAPGPACYGRGGSQTTVTDCNLALGYLNPDNFLGGGMRLDAAAAREAIRSHVAAPLGLSIEAAADGVTRIVNVKMQEAIKAISTMRGHDLRDFTLLAFGGAGPLHAGAIAQELGMAGVLVPPHPGVFSAMGLLMSDVAHDYVLSRLTALAQANEGAVTDIFAGLIDHAADELEREGFAREVMAFHCALDLRYAGQGYELSTPCAARLEPGDLARLRVRFDDAHRASFGHAAPDEPVEIVSWRVRGVGRVPPVASPRPLARGAGVPHAATSRPAWFGGASTACPVYQREQLAVGARLTGPAIIEQLDCTTVVFPGLTARVDELGNIRMQKDA